MNSKNIRNNANNRVNFKVNEDRNILNKKTTLDKNVEYIQNTQLENKFSNLILVFDFDRTITTYHTGGTPQVHPKNPKSSLNYFGSEQDTLSLRDFLIKYSKDYNIYINSRGISSMIVEYLKAYNFFQYISGVYGAKDLQSVSLGDVEWTNIKVNINNTIKKSHNIENKEQIIFFDDTINNIIRSKENEFNNSYVVPTQLSLTQKVDYFQKIIKHITENKKISNSNKNIVTNNIKSYTSLPQTTISGTGNMITKKRKRNTNGNNSKFSDPPENVSITTNNNINQRPKKREKPDTDELNKKIDKMKEINNKINTSTSSKYP